MKNQILLACTLFLISSSAAFADAVEDLPSVITNFHVVNSGIYRGARPNAEGIQALAKAGVRTIIDLQGGDRETLGSLVNVFEPGETRENIAAEGREAETNGIRFLNEPLNSLHDVTPDEGNTINEVLYTLADPGAQPVYVHCEHGKDRTGLVIALYRVFYENWTPKAAHDEMIADGHSGFLDHFFTGDLDEYFYKVTGMKP